LALEVAHHVDQATVAGHAVEETNGYGGDHCENQRRGGKNAQQLAVAEGGKSGEGGGSIAEHRAAYQL
jgi:hypothetical protein